MLNQFENKTRRVCWESHMKWESTIWSRKLQNSSLELLTHSSEKSMPRVPLEWQCVGSTAVFCRGSEGLCPGLFPVNSLTLRPSFLPTAAFFRCPQISQPFPDTGMLLMQQHPPQPWKVGLRCHGRILDV